MKRFHSTLSRRDFMKSLGFAGAGIGAAAASAPVFHDLDEAPEKFKSNPQPWFVKEVDKPTVEIDYSVLQRHNMETLSTYTPFGNIQKYWGEGVQEQYNANRAQKKLEHLLNKDPGNDLKATALNTGALFGWTRDFPQYFMGDPYPMTPERLGCPKWQGTPEENNKIITAALKFYGAAKVAFAKLDNDTRKFFWLKGRDYEGPVNINTWSAGSKSRWLEFEDVDQPYTTEDKKVIPNKFTNAIVFEIPQSDRLTRNGPAAVPQDGRVQAASAIAYSNLGITERRFQRFMQTLGYHALSGGTGSLAPVTSWAVLSGLGEASRMNPLLTVEWGTMIRSTVIIVTDMEIAPTKPIDAGMFKFCHSCRRCADACPYGSLSSENEPTWETAGFWNIPGVKKFMIDYSKCQIHRESSNGCDNCMCACVFSKQPGASIHDVTKAIVANTSLFNGFFTGMDDLFGYGDMKDPEEWWELNLPSGGINTSIGTKTFH